MQLYSIYAETLRTWFYLPYRFDQSKNRLAAVCCVFDFCTFIFCCYVARLPRIRGDLCALRKRLANCATSSIVCFLYLYFLLQL